MKESSLILKILIFFLLPLFAATQTDTLFFVTDSLKAIGKYESDLKSGKWSWFYLNGKKQSEGYYYKDKPVGIWTNWLKDGRIIAELTYDSTGRRNGRLIEYDYEIPEIHELQFKNDTLSGPAFWKRFDGTIIIQGKYKKGKRVNEWRWYWPNSNLQAKGETLRDTLNGKWQYFFQNGMLDSEGTFSFGIKEGCWKFYSEETGQLIRKETYLHNKKDGIWEYFNNKGKKIREEKYSKDNLIYGKDFDSK